MVMPTTPTLPRVEVTTLVRRSDGYLVPVGADLLDPVPCPGHDYPCPHARILASEVGAFADAHTALGHVVLRGNYTPAVIL
jgi:hypothetical protein